MQKQQALEKVRENISNENLVKHMIEVGQIMKDLAVRMNKDPEQWETIGILHDIDYEKCDYKQHGLVGAEMLPELEKESRHAIKAHNFENTGVEPESDIDYALIAADAISGIIVACALVMPNRKVSSVKIDTILKKTKDNSFARNIDRSRLDFCEKLGYRYPEFCELALKSVNKIAPEIGL